jgi:voltage-gated potassium channel
VQKIHTHNNFYYFTAALILVLLASAILDSIQGVDHQRLFQAAIFIAELVAYFSLKLSKGWRWFVGLMLVLMLLVNIQRELAGTGATTAALPGLLVMLIFFCGMAYTAARQVLFSGNIELNTIVGTVAVYLLLGLIWTIMYLIALEYWPNGFNGIDYQHWDENFSAAAYFSFVTMSTLGYGDINPAVPIIRTLAYLQAICGTFYVAVVVASLVSAHGKTTESIPKK